MADRLPPDPWARPFLWRLLWVTLLVGASASLAGALLGGCQRVDRESRSTVLGAGAPLTVYAPALPDTGRLLPGILDVSDVEATADGWVVLDAQAGLVLLIDPRGRPGPLRGRRGPGPGELARPVAVARRGREVGVLDAGATRLDVFPAGESSGDPLPLPPGACVGPVARDLRTGPGGWLVLRGCVAGGTSSFELLRVAPGGAVAQLRFEPGDARRLDPFFEPLLLIRDGIYLGSTRSPCLEQVEGTGPDHVCLPTGPPLPLPDPMRRALEGGPLPKARSLGIRVEVGRELPAVMGVRDAGPAVAFRRLRADGSEFWTLAADSGLTEIVLPSEVRGEPGPTGMLLLRQDLEGVRVWVVSLPTGGS